MSDLTSIIVCTYNRADFLEGTLGLLLDLTPLPGRPFEVILVDNNSSDATPEVAARVLREHPHAELLRLEHESAQGLSYARNRGIEAARGDFLIFVDDDILVRDPWLQVYQDARTRLPAASGFAGKVIPHFEVDRPSWLTNEQLGVLAVVDHGGFQRDLDPDHLPMGANMAFGRTTFERHGTFRTDLGRRGRLLYSNEDDEFIRRLFASGERVVYLPKALVEHIVPAVRLTKRYFRRWKYQTGRTSARALSYHDTLATILGVPRYMYLQLLHSGLWYLLRWIGLDADGAFQDELRIRYLLGFMREKILAPSSSPPS